jgi:methyl-accepting chemotaxis protein
MTALMFALLTASIQFLAYRNAQFLADLNRDYDMLDQTVMPLVAVTKGLELDVSQVQQFLSDISATRAQDDLDDGYKNAEESAVTFRKEIVEAKRLAQQLGNAALVAAIDRVAAGFESYYADGKLMAEAYIKEGPAGGNPKMPAFDKQADALQDGLTKVTDLTKAVSERGRAQTSQSIAQLGAAIGLERIITYIFAALALLLAIAIASILTRSVSRPLTAMTKAMKELADGHLETVVPDLDRKDEMGRMAQAVQVFRDNAVALKSAEAQVAERHRLAEEEREERDRRDREAAHRDAESAKEVAHVLDALGTALERLAQDDLSCRLDQQFADAYRKVQGDFNSAIDQLRHTIGTIVSSTREVSNAAAEISASTIDLSQRTEEQAASLEQTSASMEEISVTVKKNASDAQQAAQFATAASEVAGRGGSVVTKAVGAMSRIDESSRKISDIIGVIDEIARQTNLLALNAAVEAARAGDAGRGFAVVASEVRSLAQRSSQAAKDIKDLITNSNTQVKEGVDLVNQTGSSLSDIVEAIKKVADIVTNIAAASAEQSIGLDQVNKALAQMDEVTQQNSALVEENAATAKTLEQQSQEMNDRVSRFRLGGDAGPVPAAPPTPSRGRPATSAPRKRTAA